MVRENSAAAYEYVPQKGSIHNVGAGGDVSVKAGTGSGDAPVGGSVLLQSGAGEFGIVATFRLNRMTPF
jgi:hypothetical protein